MSLSFISDENLKKHIAETIKSYGENLQPYDIKKFNANIIDPIKLLFDKKVYGSVGKKLSRVKFFGNAINPIITVLVIFTKIFSDTSRAVPFQKPAGI